MRQIQVYIEGNKLELFEDEQIQITSSVQNIADISKVFTDFSQSFTVPASTVNNAIFKHFYQSDVGDIDTPGSLIDHNIRRNAVIEIDLTTFRRGKIQIEKANIKNGLPENYQLTFYGEIRTLKDAFGEDKINQLDLTSLEFTYAGGEIYDRIIDTASDYDVRYPLIASDRLWTYKAGGEDITTTSKAIRYDELFPAVKISKLFEAIENDYGLTFQGTFLSDPRFTNVFLYGKNSIDYTWVSEAQYLNILSYPAAAANIFDAVNDTVNYEYTTSIGQGVPFEPSNAVHSVSAFIGGGVNDDYYIDVYLNGTLFTTINGSGTNTYTLITQDNTAGLQSQIKIAVRGLQSFTFSSSILYNLSWVSFPEGPNSLYYSTINSSTTVTGNINLNNTLPDIKVADFFAGVLNEFNMTCVGIEKDVFEILPLDDWYSQGAIVDITEYTDIDSIDIERIKLYKKIGFKYQQSESFVNRQFFKLSNSEYGNTEYQFDYDGDEYNVEVPFENLLFTRAEETNTPANYAILGYCLNENYQAYTPKPILLYLYGASQTLTHNIKFYNGVSNDNISSYALFGQDLTYQNTKYSLNFGAENSIIHLETIQQGLYAEYYFSYLVNFFNLKNRLTYVKTNLPISLLTNLRLNDRLVIRDKRYIINEMKSNLTTGEVNFSLYLDFRPMNAGKPIVPSFDAQCLSIPIKWVNGAVSATITTTFGGVTISPSTITSSQFITVCIPENTNTTQYILAENGDFLITEEYQNYITENSTVQVIVLTITYTLSDGSTVVQTQTILQQ